MSQDGLVIHLLLEPVRLNFLTYFENGCLYINSLELHNLNKPQVTRIWVSELPVMRMWALIQTKNIVSIRICDLRGSQGKNVYKC